MLCTASFQSRITVSAETPTTSGVSGTFESGEEPQLDNACLPWIHRGQRVQSIVQGNEFGGTLS